MRVTRSIRDISFKISKAKEEYIEANNIEPSEEMLANMLNVETIKICIYLAIFIYTLSIFILYFVNLKLFNKGVNVD